MVGGQTRGFDRRPRNDRFWIIVTVSGLAVLAVLFAFTQHRIQHGDGQGFDGVEYHAMAEQISDGVKVSADAPFVTRVGTPAIAAAISSSTGVRTIDAFEIANALAGAAFFALLFVYFRTVGVSPRWTAILTLITAVSMLTPIRSVLFYPVQSDPIPWCLGLVALIALERVTRTWLTPPTYIILLGIAMVGVLFREQLLLVAIAISVQLLVRARPTCPPLLACIPVVGAASVALLTRLFVTTTGNYSFIDAALNSLKSKGPDDMLLSYFRTFGIVAVLSFVFGREVWRWIAAEPYRLVIVVGTVGLSWLGGTDTERFLATAIPILFAAVGLSIDRLDLTRFTRRRSLLLSAGGIAAVLLSSGFLLPLRDSIEPTGLTGSMLMRGHHSIPLLSMLNAPTFAANETAFSPAILNLVLLLEWLAVTVLAMVALHPGIGRRASPRTLARRARNRVTNELAEGPGTRHDASTT
jgi:hypothetical protein